MNEQPKTQQKPVENQAPTSLTQQSVAPSNNKNKMRLLSMLAILILLLIGGGALAYVAGWLPGGRTLEPDVVISHALSNILDIKSAQYEIKLAFQSEEREEGAIPWAAELPEFQEKKQAIKRDRERLADLSTLQFSIRSYFEENRIDPPSLKQLAAGNTTLANRILDPETKQPYGYRQEAGGADFVLHIQLETEAAVEAYQKAFEDDDEEGSPTIHSERIIEVTKDTPIVYVSVDFSDISPYPITFSFDELYQYLPVEISAVLELTGQNESDVSKTNDAAYSASGRVALGGTTLNGAADLRKKGEDYYLKIGEAPSLGFFDLAALKQKWIKATPQDTYGTFLGNSLYRSGQKSVDERSVRLVRQYQLILQLVQEEDVLQVVQEFPKVKEGNSSLYHYQIKLDRNKFASFYSRLAQAVEEEFGDEAIIKFNQETVRYLEGEEFERFYGALDKNVVLELWIDAKNFWPRRFTYTIRLVPPDSVLKLKELQYRLALTVGLDNINDPITVEIPADTMSVDEARVLLTGEPIEQVRLSRQRSQVEAVRNALAAYLAHTGTYPGDTAQLLKKISEVPAGPEQPSDDDPFSIGKYSLKQLKEKDAPFLYVIPQDVITNQPYSYTSTGTSYELKYTIQLPPQSEDTLSNYRYESNRRTFIEGANTATPEQLSLEGSSQ